MYFSKIEEICKTRNDISFLTKLNLQNVVKSRNGRFSQRMNNTHRRAEETASTEQSHTRSTPLAKDNKTGSSHVVCI